MEPSGPVQACNGIALPLPSSQVLLLEHNFVTEHLGKEIRNTLKFVKFGAAEGWQRSVSPIL